MYSCDCGRIHTFVCYLRSLATDANRAAMNAGRALNAR